MASRIFNQPPPTTPVVTPANHVGWNDLIRQVIERAELRGDRRLSGLRKSLTDGRAEAHLRRLGIISETDLHREFPTPDK